MKPIRVVRIVTWTLLGGLLILVGIKAGLLDRQINDKRATGAAYEYTGMGAVIYGCVFIALGMAAIWFGISGDRWGRLSPNAPEMKGWRLWLYRVYRLLGH